MNKAQKNRNTHITNQVLLIIITYRFNWILMISQKRCHFSIPATQLNLHSNDKQKTLNAVLVFFCMNLLPIVFFSVLLVLLVRLMVIKIQIRLNWSFCCFLGLVIKQLKRDLSAIEENGYQQQQQPNQFSLIHFIEWINRMIEFSHWIVRSHTLSGRVLYVKCDTIFRWILSP